MKRMDFSIDISVVSVEVGDMGFTSWNRGCYIGGRANAVDVVGTVPGLGVAGRG
jgi:hypothetical protein